MPFPAWIDTVTVVGSVVGFDDAARGKVRVTVPFPITHTIDSDVFAAKIYTEDLADDGSFSIEFPGNDSAGTTPLGFRVFFEVVTNVYTKRFYTLVPGSVTPIEYSSLVPAEPVGDFDSYVTLADLQAETAARIAGDLVQMGPVLNVKAYGAVGDGVTDDTAAIQDAIADLDNATLYFPAGDYLTTGLLIEDHHFFTVKGERGASLWIVGPSTADPLSCTNNVLSIVDCTGFVLDGLHVDGRRDTIAPIAPLVANAATGQPSIRIASGAGAAYRVGQKLTVNGGLDVNAGAESDFDDQFMEVLSITPGVSFDTVTFTTNLTHNYSFDTTIIDDGYGPFAAEGAYLTPWQCGSATVAGRVLTEEDQQNGIHLINCLRFDITGCTVHGMWESPIRLGTHRLVAPFPAQADGCEDGSITRNVLYHCNDQGVGLWISNRVTVTGNVIRACGWAGISATLGDDNTITGNVCSGNIHRIPGDNNSGHGVAIEGGRRNTVTGNQLKDNYAVGVYLTAGGTFPFGGPAQVATTVDVLSDEDSLPQATINVASAAAFAAAGTVSLLSSAGVQFITYTGKTGTTLTGCSGGIGTLYTGQRITQYPVFIDEGADLEVGSTSITVTDGTLFQVDGIYSIVDGPRTERISPSAIVGNVLTLAEPTVFRHHDLCQIGQAVCEGNTISGNAISGTDADAGIRLSAAVRTTLDSNTIDRAGLRGIDLEIWAAGGLQAPHGTVISNNTVTAPDAVGDGAAYQGISVILTSDVAIVNNYVAAAPSTQGYFNALNIQGITDSIVEGNAVADGYAIGMMIGAYQDEPCRRVIVAGNRVLRTLGEGIIIEAGDDLIFRDNLVMGCASNDGPAGFGGGINVKGLSNSIFANNAAINNGHAGILLDEITLDDGVIRYVVGNLFSGNLVRDDGRNIDTFSGDPTQQGYGIREAGAGHGPNSYVDNRVSGNGTNWALTSTDNSARGNTNYPTTQPTDALPLAGGTLTGNLLVRDSATPTKAYQFRTNGGSLDTEAGGADWYFSVWANADFSGAQRTYLRLEAGAQVAHAVGRWVISSSPFGGTTFDVDPDVAPSGGIAFFGGGVTNKQTVTGATTDDIVASLVAALAAYGLITDGT